MLALQSFSEGDFFSFAFFLLSPRIEVIATARKKMDLNKAQVITDLLGLCRSDIEKRYGEQALDIHNAKLTFEKNRCVRTLFPKSSCRRCVDACREKAICLNYGAISLEDSKCTACGACVSSCPTEAFAFAKYPLYSALFELKKLLPENQEHQSTSLSAVFACPNASQAKERISVGCLGSMSPALFVLAQLTTEAKVVVYCGNCRNCASNNEGDPAKSMAKKISRFSDILKKRPEIEIAETASEALDNLKRRKIFRKISNELLEKSEIASLKGSAPKTEKVFPMLDREMFIDCIKLIREKKPEYEISEKIFPLPGVHKNTCTGCNICVLLCPSGCLTSREKDGHFKLLADPLRCVDCKRCVEACPEQTLVMRKISGIPQILADDVQILLTEVQKPIEEDPAAIEAKTREIFNI